MPDALSDDHVAIVGIAGRFPGARDVHEFWENLVNGVDSVTVLTDEQLRENGVAEHLIRDPDYVNTAPLVEDMAGFDATFFGYTPREAQIRDPQGRMFLEACHSALEDAGCDVARYDGVIGLYGGGAINNYGELNVKLNRAVFKAAGSLSIDVANHPDYLTTETSYRLNLSGPSVNVQTACSTSLVAIHLACQALRSGDCTMALAGGVEVALPYGTGHLWQEGGIFSKGGHVRSFDAGADGTIFGTGVGVVALKRLADARAGGDQIYAVVRGSAVNNDGAARSGFTAPGVAGQTRLIVDALAAAQVEPGTISYVEAHGTGTLVGDPLEVRALSQAYRQAGAAGNQFCVIGSVKANVGHLGPAAGAAGLIKVCLALKHGLLPPSVNFDKPNPAIDFEQSPFVVDTTARPWKGEDSPRRAGVSSFGIGGTNAHLILEEPPRDTVEPNATATEWRVLPVSAKTATAAAAAARRLAAHLRRNPDLRLRDVAHTLQYGRAQLGHRRAVVAGDVAQAAAALEQVTGAPAPVRRRSVVFLFPGQGSQHPGMGQDLYRRYATYRQVVDECAEMLRPIVRCDLRKLLMPTPDTTEHAAELLRQTRLTQPALFVVECALARLLASFGVEPNAMIGHSIGEYVAAHLSGVIPLEDALTLVAARGELMHSMPVGAMLAVGVPEAQLRPLLYGDVEVAAVNSPTSTVVAGPEPAIAALEAMLARQGVPATRLRTSHAFHSQMMEPIMGNFREWVADVSLAAPTRPFISNVTGTWITDEQATDPEYWVTHLRRAVRFADGLATIAEADGRVLVEVGPGRSLSDLARQCLGSEAPPIVASMRHPAKAADDEQTLLAAVAKLWTTGVAVDWSTVGTAGAPRRVSLPAYPYERQRFWVDADQRPGTVAAEDDPHARLSLEEAIFAPIWREEPVPAITTLPEGNPTWLVFSPGHGVVEALVSNLRAAGAQVVVAVPGDGFADNESGADNGAPRISIRPDERADYRALLSRFGSAPPTRIVHGWTATELAADPLDPNEVARVSALGYLSLLYLAQELDRRPADSTVDVLVVSANMQDVAGGEAIEPAKALILGPTMLINREMVRVSCRSVDLSLPSRQSDEMLVEHLRAELNASTMARAPTDAVQIAWRGHKRWTWSYQTAPVQAPPDAPPALRHGGTYLLTGGLGGLGLTIARDLAETVQARLVLVGRSPLPDRSEWGALLADDSTEAAVRSRVEAVRAIEAAGAQVMVAGCDIADEAALRAVVTAAEERFGPINGVFHAAGVAGGGMLIVRTREDSDRVMAPKVAGTLALCRVFSDRVDFISLFSSIAAVAGHYGMVDYCAANNFMDALARRLNAEGVPIHSIGWASWRTVGMVTATENAAPTIFRELEVGTRSVPVEHPLLERRILDGSGDIVVATTLTPSSHWVVTDHQIGGVGVLPGTASLEIIHAALGLAEGGGGGGKSAVEISDVVFTGPIVIAEPRELRATLRPDAGGFDVTIVTGRPEGPVREWVEHVRARARAVPARDAVSHDLDALRANCDGLRYEPARGGPDDGLVQFGAHWANSLVLQVGAGQELGRIELDERFHAECDEYTLHPALLDDAVSRSQYLPAVAERGDALLPFSYGRVTVRAPLPPRFHTHVRHLDDGAGETVSCDITLIADDGRELVQIAGYALRRVNPTSIRARVSHADAGGTAPVSVPMTERAEALDWGLEPDFGIAALYRILTARHTPHLLVSAVGLGRELQRAAGLNSDVLNQEIVDVTLTGSETMRRSLDTPYVAPQSDMEHTLSSLWAQSLGVDEVGVEDDFFELGGNSLVAVQLAARIRRQFDVELPLATLFEQSTVATLAAHVETALVEKVGAMTAAV